MGLKKHRRLPLSDGSSVIVDTLDYVMKLKGHTWCKSGNGYVHARIKGVYVTIHRFLMDAPADMHVDHRNHNPLDNRRRNLRLCTQSQNLANQRKQRGRSSRYKGVTRVKSRNCWKAQIKSQGTNRYLGHFTTEEAAAKAYNRAALETFGEFAHLNDVPENGSDLPVERLSGSRRVQVGVRGSKRLRRRYRLIVHEAVRSAPPMDAQTISDLRRVFRVAG